MGKQQGDSDFSAHHLAEPDASARRPRWPKDMLPKGYGLHLYVSRIQRSIQSKDDMKGTIE